jgi:ribonuclease I
VYKSIESAYQGVYAFSWLAGHCQYEMQMKHEYCDPSWIAPWDKYINNILSQSLTIHGIWPSNPTTSNFGKFNIKIFQDNLKLLDDMNNYWPPKTKASTTNVFLWEHEWDTHGHDYAANIFALRPDEFVGTTEQRNQRLQLAFFQEAVNFYKKFNVKKIGKNILTKG